MKKLPSSIQGEAVDLSGRSKRECYNSNCNTKTADLIDAKSVARFYFGVPKDVRSWKICQKCQLQAVKFEEESKDEIKANGNIFSLSVEAISQPEVIDLDSVVVDEVTVANSNCNNNAPTPLYAVSEDKMMDELNNMLRKFSLQEQINKCKTTLSNEVDKLAKDFGDTEKLMEQLNDNITKLHQNYNKFVKAPALELGTVDVSSNGDLKIKENECVAETLKLVGFKRIIPRDVLEFRNTVTSDFDDNSMAVKEKLSVLINTMRTAPSQKAINPKTTTTTPKHVHFETFGSTHKVIIPNICPSPKEHVPHTCTPLCAHVYAEENHRRTSPLIIPFVLGWARQFGEMEFSSVSYITPCGLRLDSYEEIHAYNRITQNNIPVEFFSLEVVIDCLNEFTPDRQLVSLKDISYGKEWTPVQCINSINYDLPDSLEYLNERKLGEDVSLNFNDEFMVCCDCTDDCKDKTKCACWQLTLSGISFKMNPLLQGYEFRRLKTWIESGIYECNHKCKCRANTCLNRVIQGKVKWPVQVFKTIAKGWGVRALYDIPQGSFLCVYTGKLLSDVAANKEGLENGDEYLADLDYIESMESKKEGYESDYADITDEDKHGNKCLKSTNLDAQTKREKLQLSRKSTAGGKLAAKEKNGEGGIDKALKTLRRSSLNVNGKLSKVISYRSYFGESDTCYSIDGKGLGNFGRYFNHSCDPNVFIQNVFVDTHDLRFPWVAFFTGKHVKAGTELCWDYKYEVGSVPGKSLICYCGSKHCRGRLL